jgi:hypothetical protein
LDKRPLKLSRRHIDCVSRVSRVLDGIPPTPRIVIRIVPLEDLSESPRDRPDRDCGIVG